MSDEQKLTLSDVEEIVNDFARKYAHDTHGLPSTAIRIILWPTDKWITFVTRGPTAIIKIGRLPGDPIFNISMRNAIDHVARHHLYECMTIEKVADIVKREDALRRIQRERYNFDSELVPHMLRDEEVIVRRFSRVEVVHRKTGKREVMEYESGQGNIFAMTEIAKARLARNIHEAAFMEPHDPFAVSSDDPNWIAKTA